MSDVMDKRPLGLILAGGESKRLFPIRTPKPLLRIENKSLLEMAIERLSGFRIQVIVNQGLAKVIEEDFRSRGLQPPKFSLEPEGRDTAAAVGFGLRENKNSSPPWVAVLSADHWMKKNSEFQKFLKVVEIEVKKFPDALFVAGSLARSKPRESHSQFGWVVPEKMERGAKSAAVKLFVEKPEGKRLEKLRTQGGLINAGMFFGNYQTFLKAYQKLYPDVLNSTFSYADLKQIPIDRAIFEKFENVRIIRLDLDWADLGIWKDWFDRVGRGPGAQGIKVRSPDVLISSDGDIEVYSFENKDLAIIQSGKRVLVMPLSKSKDLKKILESL